MQGDIYQLEDILRHQAEDTTIAVTPLKPTPNTVAVTHYFDDFESTLSPHISVYNDDDFSTYLYNGIAPLASYHHESIPSETVHLKSKKAKTDTKTQVHYLEAIASAFDDYYTDAPSVLPATEPQSYQQHRQQQKDNSGIHFSVYAYDSGDEDECAISTDDEDDDNDGYDSHSTGSPATPTSDAGTCRHFHTRHIGSPPGDEQPPVRPVLSRKSTAMPSATAAVRTVPLIAQPKRQAAVIVSPASHTTETIPAEQHVNRIEGHMMSWWPLPVEKAEYEWNERFYE